jgi:hypothetical protein
MSAPGPTTNVVVTSVQPLTPDGQAVLELGRKLYMDSVETVRDTCKLLVTLSASAIPVYVALLRIVVRESVQMTLLQTCLFVLPGVCFLASMLVAALGLRPIKDSISLSVLEDIVRYRDKLLKKRGGAAQTALVLFGAGVGLALVAATVFVACPPAGAAALPPATH